MNWLKSLIESWKRGTEAKKAAQRVKAEYYARECERAAYIARIRQNRALPK